MSKYNASVKEIRNGEHYCTFVAEVETISGKLQMLRGNGISCTGYEGKVSTFKDGSDLQEKYGNEPVALYHVYMLESHPNSTFEILLDNCEFYKNILNKMF